jgi:hypothetical protein
MKYKLYIKTFVLLYFCFFLNLTLAIAQNFELKGRIVDSESQQFLDEVSVTLRGTAFGQMSVAGGNFNFKNIVPGRYVLSLNLDGYTEPKVQVPRFKKPLGQPTLPTCSTTVPICWEEIWSME